MAKTKAAPRIKITPRMEKDSLTLHQDGLSNYVTGLGIEGVDNRKNAKLSWNGVMAEPAAERIYGSGFLAKRIIDKLPSDALRRNIEVVGFDNDADVKKEMRRLKVRPTFKKAAIWGRLYGGAHVFVNDGSDPSTWNQPLDLAKLQQIKSLLVLNRWEMPVSGNSFESDIVERFGLPNLYRLTPHRVATPDPKVTLASIHHTRLISFHGAELPLRLFITNAHYHDSIFNLIAEQLTDYLQANAGISAALQRFRLVIHGIQNLSDYTGAGQRDKIKKRIRDLQLVLSVLGEMVVDQEKEKIDVHTDNYAGVNDIIEQLKGLLAACTEYPKIVLFNESPEGSMGGNGSSELEGYYNTVEDYQEDTLRPRYDRFFEILFACKQGPTKGTNPDDWSYTFPPLWQMSRGDVAKAELAEAQADDLRLQQGVLNEIQIMENRYPDIADQMSDQDKQQFLDDKAMKEAQQQELANRMLAQTGPIPKTGKGQPDPNANPDPNAPEPNPKK